MKPLRPLHLEIQTHRLNPVGLLRSSFRQDGKVLHSNHGRLTGLDLDQLKLIQACCSGKRACGENPLRVPQDFEENPSKSLAAGQGVSRYRRFRSPVRSSTAATELDPLGRGRRVAAAPSNSRRD